MGWIIAFLAALVVGALGFLVWIGIASADESSWIWDGKCVTIYWSENHAFSPDHHYAKHYCEKKR